VRISTRILHIGILRRCHNYKNQQDCCGNKMEGTDALN
jgi:hypothetical protein